jgi:hypothetical protein
MYGYHPVCEGSGGEGGRPNPIVRISPPAGSASTYAAPTAVRPSDQTRPSQASRRHRSRLVRQRGVSVSPELRPLQQGDTPRPIDVEADVLRASEAGADAESEAAAWCGASSRAVDLVQSSPAAFAEHDDTLPGGARRRPLEDDCGSPSQRSRLRPRRRKSGSGRTPGRPRRRARR